MASTDGLTITALHPALGARVDGIVLVVHGDKTSREALRKAREKLDLLKVRTLGVIINNLAIDRQAYHYKDYYYHYYHRS